MWGRVFFTLTLCFTIGLCAKGSGLCMNELFGGNGLTCVANDVRVVELIAVNNTIATCQQGELVTAHLIARVISGAITRYDIGIVLAVDGGDGLSGVCDNYNLDPVSVDNTDLDLVGGFGPYYNGELGTGDLCGDIRSADGNNYVDLGNVTFVCRDANMDGVADVNGGVGWDNNVSDGTLQKPHCFGPDDPSPGTKSKCHFNDRNIDTLFCNTTLGLVDDWDSTLQDVPITLNVTANDVFNFFSANFLDKAHAPT